MITRRQFLQGSALLAAAAFVSPLSRLLAQDRPVVDDLAAYLTALESPFAAPLNAHFEALIGGNSISVLLYDLNTRALLTALAAEQPLPVASAFKAPLLVYFLDQTDPAVWNTVPLEHWLAPGPGAVLEAYRADWQRNQAILRALYQAVVISDNQAAGEILTYVARAHGSTQPLALFNDWLHNRVGLSQLSALSSWSQGIAADMSAEDARYMNRGTSIHGQVFTFENLMTARDLGLSYVWMSSGLTPDGLRVARGLLSVIRDERRANLETLAYDLEGLSYSKNGSLILDEGTVITDAGLIELPDGRRYLLVMLSLAAPLLLDPLFEELGHTLRGRYNEMIHNHRYYVVSSADLLAAYTAHLGAAYPAQTDAQPGLYRYGFVLPEGVEVYGDPADREPLRNPIIRSTRFGVHLLMQGALVRYIETDADWIELIPDDSRDNVRVRLGPRLFLRRRDVWPIALDYAAPIPYLSDPTITASDKFIVIHLTARELVAFEGTTPVLRVPVIINTADTPRGVRVITSKWFARSMQPWAPGVPFTCFFGDQGYALHGSPWQRWSATVNQSTIAARTTAGCINVPDWLVQAGDTQRPADELLFRWIGGMENPRDRVFDYPTDTYPALRIFSVDYAADLRSYHRPEGLLRFETSWDEAIARIEQAPLQAPDSFFV